MRDMVIVSDDAGQFDVLRHALCWIHAERIFVKLVGFNDAQREALDAVRTGIWELYAELKAYKTAPRDEKKAQLDARFDELCATQTGFVTLNNALKRKISGSTRSKEGRRCRDTFASLKKTCRKNGVSFWDYLADRIRGTCQIPPLAELIRQQASLGSGTLTRAQPAGS